MKKIYALLLTLLPLFGFSQITFEWHTDSVSNGEVGDDTGFDYTMTNTYSNAVDITWEFLHDTATSQTSPGVNIWQDYMCEGIFVCWPYNKRTNNFVLEAGEDIDIYHHIQSYTGMDTGTFISEVLWYETNDSANTVEKITVTVNISEPEEDPDPEFPEGIGSMDEVGSRLAQNAPNPFRGVTRIDYALDGSNGLLKFQDLTGKLVMQVPLNKQQGTVTLEGALDGGIYFYSLWEDGVMIDSKRMQVID